ncbi:MAG: aspartate kinase [Flavobacteriaceae bacterium]|nr:aspartate kinase [Flavobacteriaceae bacterium]MCY4215762.1 aspartate kinase [Flavobacteriaceae bacterium]MCY4254004.1 aspartate kinase [Flavobacteriaceae bacterium]
MNATTVSFAVTEYIKQKPFLSTALDQGIINLTALARMIKSDIEKKLNKKVQKGALVMALKRISDTLEFTSTHQIVKTLRNIGEINVRSSLVDYNFKLSETLLKKQAQLLMQIKKSEDVFYTSSRGVGESNIIVSQNISGLADEIFKSETLKFKQSNLSAITIKLPEENVSIPGIYYFFFQRLSWQNINIIEVISTTNEVTLLMNDQVVIDAFVAIQKLKHI